MPRPLPAQPPEGQAAAGSAIGCGSPPAQRAGPSPPAGATGETGETGGGPVPARRCAGLSSGGAAGDLRTWGPRWGSGRSPAPSPSGACRQAVVPPSGSPDSPVPPAPMGGRPAWDRRYRAPARTSGRRLSRHTDTGETSCRQGPMRRVATGAFVPAQITRRSVPSAPESARSGHRAWFCSRRLRDAKRPPDRSKDLALAPAGSLPSSRALPPPTSRPYCKTVVRAWFRAAQQSAGGEQGAAGAQGSGHGEAGPWAFALVTPLCGVTQCQALCAAGWAGEVRAERGSDA